MGNKFFWTGATALLLLCGCQNRVIDTKRSEFTDQSDHWNVKTTLTQLSSEHKQTDEKCTRFNMQVQRLADSLQAAVIAQAARDYDGELSVPDSLVISYELLISDTLFSLSNRLVSLRMTVYTFTGGAHGGTDYYALNYDLDKEVFLSPKQLLDYTKEQEINTLLARHFKNESGCFSEVPTLNNGFTALNIGKESVCFTYPQYALGAYACGAAKVSVPKKELTGLLLYR